MPSCSALIRFPEREDLVRFVQVADDAWLKIKHAGTNKHPQGRSGRASGGSGSAPGRKSAIDRVGNRAGRLEGQFDRLQNRLNGFRSVFIGLVGILGVRAFTNLGDTVQTIDNRLKLVTNTTQELNAVYRELVGVSRETRTSLAANAELFLRIGLNTRQLGLSYRELIKFTRNLNLALVISSARAQEASLALIQLSQGLASNRLSGDELRSVLEQLPRVADVIAQRFNITRGELREFGKQGRITAQAVFEAFTSPEAQRILETEFARIVPTIESAFTVLGNSIIDFARAANQSTGIFRTLALGVLYLADNIKVLIGVLSVFATVIITRVLVAMALFTAALAG